MTARSDATSSKIAVFDLNLMGLSLARGRCRVQRSGWQRRVDGGPRPMSRSAEAIVPDAKSPEGSVVITALPSGPTGGRDVTRAVRSGARRVEFCVNG